MLAETIANGDFFENEALAEKVEGENLSIVVIVDNLRPRGCLSGEASHPGLPISDATPCKEHEQ
jgi:hypothetical protein